MYLVQGLALIAANDGDRAALKALHTQFLRAANSKNVGALASRELKELAELALQSANTRRER